MLNNKREQYKVDVLRWFNSVHSKMVNVWNGVFGDLYDSANWIGVLLILLTAV